MSDSIGIPLPMLTSRDALLATMARGSYDSNFQPPAGSDFEKLVVVLRNDDGTPYVASNGFSAQAWINKSTGEVVVAYTGSNELKDFIGADAAAINGRWHPQFDDAGRFAVAAKQAAAEILNPNDDPNGVRPALITTGHSLGGMLAQVVSRLTGAEGRAFDAPGVQALTDTEGFRLLAASLHQPESGYVISGQQFISYRTGPVGSLGGTPVGSQESIIALNDPSLTPFLLGVGLGILNPAAGLAVMAGGGAILETHGMDGIERAVYGLLELQKQFGSGQLQVVDMPFDQASGQPWPYEGQPTNTKAILDGQGNVLAYADRNDGLYELVIKSSGTRLIFREENGVPKLEERRIGETSIVHDVQVELGTTVPGTWQNTDKAGNNITAVTNADGTITTTVTNSAGTAISTSNTITFEDGSTSETVRYFDGRTIRTNTDENGVITSRASIQYFEEDNSSIETVTYANGRTVKLSYDGDGKLLSQQEVPSGLQTLIAVNSFVNGSGNTLLDSLRLIQAIQNGEPLPIVASGLRLANDISPNVQLTAAASAVSGVLSLMSLDAALERGDTLGAVTAGAQAISFSATAYANFAVSSGAASSSAEALGAAGGMIGTVGKALPYLNLINSIENGDEAGTAVATLAVLESMGAFAAGGILASATMAATVPVIGWIYAVYSIVSALMADDDIPDPWGNGKFVWDGHGITYQAAGETGGKEATANVMATVLNTMNSLIERTRQQNPGSALGLIPNRMPGIGYDTSGYRYTDIDPLTGAEQHPALRFDTAGNPYNAEAGTPESYQSIVEGMLYSALDRGAIAPMWEVETARLQTDAGDPQAGLTEEERAARDGRLAAPLTGSSQTFRPVVLDLDGDGIEIDAAGVAFDVDDSGYLKETDWVKGDDGFLVVDRNTNGRVDSGRELFSNGTVDLSRRGLAGMAWVDANYDGKLTGADPVWNELKVWQDGNQDGAQEAGETHRLADLGITELDYAMGTFTRNGVKQQLASPDLQADKDGSRINVVPEGILVQESADGHLSLLVTRVDDRTAVEANRDGITGYEDVETIGNARNDQSWRMAA